MPMSIRRNNISRESRREIIDNYRRFYFCDWESSIGYGVAISLAIFEAKRLLIIILELFIQWNVIRMAGGYQPVIFSITDTFVGFFTAIKTILTLRNLDAELLNLTCKRTLKCLLILIFICILMNVLTLVAVGYNVSVKEPTLANIFNNLMNHYNINESDKLIVDRIQFDLQCCGYSNYNDWFRIKWQITKNIPGYNSIDETNNWNVPFSCCNIQNVGICAHTEMTKDDINTINNRGCAGILSDIILKILCIAYAMGIIIIVTQIFLAFYIVRMLMKCFREYSKYTTDISQSSLLLSESNGTENDPRPSRRQRLGYNSSKKKLVSSKRPRHCYSFNTYHHNHHKESSLDSSSNLEAAQISPSIHSEHRVP